MFDKYLLLDEAKMLTQFFSVEKQRKSLRSEGDKVDVIGKTKNEIHLKMRVANRVFDVKKEEDHGSN